VQLNATASVPGSFIYTPGQGTILNAGSNQTLSVNFSPTDQTNYGAVNGTTVLISVTKATPTITWSKPAAITYGTPLGVMQLNASATTTGAFAYSPPGGTVLKAGANQSLSVNFTPSDAVNYNVVNGATVLITVGQAALTAKAMTSQGPMVVLTRQIQLRTPVFVNGDNATSITHPR